MPQAWPAGAGLLGCSLSLASLFPFDRLARRGMRSQRVFLFARIPPALPGPGSTSTALISSAMRRWAFPGAGPDALGLQAQTGMPLAFLAGTLLSLCMEFLRDLSAAPRAVNLDLRCSMPAAP